MQNINLTGSDKGPGIAASVVMLVLIDELVKKDVLTHSDVARILAIADGIIQGWGQIASAQDARRVLDQMRGLRS
jgi:hypothetical protein